jgi:hypothetical protein
MRASIAAHTGSRWNFALLVVVTLILARTYLADAQAPVRNLPPCPSPDAYAQVIVTRAFKNTSHDADRAVELGDDITVEVQNLTTLFDKAKCTTPNKKILLFLDGRPVKDAIPFPPTDPRKPFLIFPLKRTEVSRDTWTYILGESKWTPRPTAVSVGLEDEYAVESTSTINLQVIPRDWFIFWLLIFILLLIAFWVLAIKSDVLRDVGSQPAGQNARKPYSLARTQAAWWFFVILASYLFIGIITGDFSTTITGTVLGLLGISAGTVVGSAFIDAGKDSTPIAPAAPAAPVAPAAPAAAAAPAAPAVPAAPGALPAGGPAAVAPQIAQNEYWWVDILSDASGVSFHRFQIAAWTLVLGIIFIIQVYKVLAMPTFNDSLLALLGISAGTYLGLKIPEPTTPKQ